MLDSGVFSRNTILWLTWDESPVTTMYLQGRFLHFLTERGLVEGSQKLSFTWMFCVSRHFTCRCVSFILHDVKHWKYKDEMSNTPLCNVFESWLVNTHIRPLSCHPLGLYAVLTPALPLWMRPSRLVTHFFRHRPNASQSAVHIPLLNSRATGHGALQRSPNDLNNSLTNIKLSKKQNKMVSWHVFLFHLNIAWCYILY